MLAFLSSFCAAALAVSAVVRARASISRWAFAAGMAAFALEAFCAGMSAGASDLTTARQWQQLRLGAESFVPFSWFLFSITYARGNGRRFLGRSWTPLLVLAAIPLLFLVVRNEVLAIARNSAAGTYVFRLPWSGMALQMLLLLGAVAVVMNLERTFRASVGTIRWRTKFMLLGVGVIFVARIYAGSQVLVFRGIDPALEDLNAVALLVATPLILRSLVRAGHFDLDVYPSELVLKNSVTVLLAGAYLLLVGLLANIVSRIGGDSAFAVKAFVVLIALVGLAVVLQSDRARLWLRRFVSRNFQRPMYDYRTVWRRFTDATTSRDGPGALAESVIALTADIVQALSVSLWTVNERRDGFTPAASTCSHRATLTAPQLSPASAAEVMEYFAGRGEPVDIETISHGWAATLREMHPTLFAQGGRRVCIPLQGRGELLGVILIGDRVGGMPWSLQDFEMLKCVGEQISASLMNVRLSQQLLQAKELEAFQSMAAFFVHDLKNAAATLTLMLQNLPVHFDNPEFRADALRGVEKTVEHINALLNRLRALRRELKVELSDGDLNEVVSEALAGLEYSQAAIITKDTQPLPSLKLDREQFNKVVTNLVLNATEAAPASGGRVHVTTAHENGWVVLTVADNGCGMSEEFLNKYLFRPFQTSKASGLGIGMFQSKMIVEAHGGRIAAASRPGKGATFQVFLRAPARQLSPNHVTRPSPYETEIAHRRR